MTTERSYTYHTFDVRLGSISTIPLPSRSCWSRVAAPYYSALTRLSSRVLACVVRGLAGSGIGLYTLDATLQARCVVRCA